MPRNLTQCFNIGINVVCVNFSILNHIYLEQVLNSYLSGPNDHVFDGPTYSKTYKLNSLLHENDIYIYIDKVQNYILKE